jgi:hypothetical protein
MKSCVGEERKPLSYANSPQSNNHSLALSLSLSLSLSHSHKNIATIANNQFSIYS